MSLDSTDSSADLSCLRAAQDQGLTLSGRIIVAVTNLPKEIVYIDSTDSYALHPRRGNSALYSSIDALIHTDWDSLVVGWPGEIKRLPTALAGAEYCSNIPGGTNSSSVVSDGHAVLSEENRKHIEELYNQQNHSAKSSQSLAPVWLPGSVEEPSSSAESNGTTVEGQQSKKPTTAQNSPNSDSEGSSLKSKTNSAAHTSTRTSSTTPSSKSSASRWRLYPENVIWPIMHYILDDNFCTGRSDHMSEWWQDYVTFNETYRDKILEVYKTGDVIWIHDYYLFLLPQMIRMRRPDAVIGTFIHAPFPSSEYFRCIPQRANILESLLGSNLIGLQSYSYTRHFISACTRLLGVEASDSHINAFGMYVRIATLPIGIDTVAVEKAAFCRPVDEKVKAIRRIYPDKKIIVGRDRLDSIRGLIQKLQALEKFFERHPDWASKIVLIQVTSPAYTFAGSSEADQKTEQRVAELISRINGKYGTIKFVPVHHYAHHIARDEYLALLRVADLGLITSVRDGMNTTMLEFLVCQKENCSPVIVSEFTGTAGSIRDVVEVNPWDSVEVAETIYELLQDDEQTHKSNRIREQRLYEYVTTHTGADWVKEFIRAMMHNIVKHKCSHVTPLLDTQLMMQKYRAASKRLFLFDYDGTLTPIVKEPSAAIPSPRLYNILDALTSDERNDVWIISGRDQQFLDTWLWTKNKSISFSAEHGCFVKVSKSAPEAADDDCESEITNGGRSDHTRSSSDASDVYPPGVWVNLLDQTDMSWQPVVADILMNYTERTQGSSVEHKRAALTWHYRRADPVYGAFQARNLKDYLETTVVPQYEIEVMSGKANVEVRPRKFNKGEIVKAIVRDTIKRQNIGHFGEEETLEETLAKENCPFIFCVGDDSTDEDMFSVLGNYSSADDGVFSVTVGPPSKLTVASWHLLDPQQVLDSLAALMK